MNDVSVDHGVTYSLTSWTRFPIDLGIGPSSLEFQYSSLEHMSIIELLKFKQLNLKAYISFSLVRVPRLVGSGPVKLSLPAIVLEIG